jgi:hypothetical protein
MITEVTRTVEMPCIPWPIDESGIHPEKGTWTLTPASLQTLRPDIQALLSCPHCAAILPFSQVKTDNVDRQHHTGTLIRNDLRCKCGFLFTAKLLEWDKRRLYCIVYEILDPNRMHVGETVNTRKEYMHAESRAQAIWLFSQGHMRESYQIVEAGAVFGYFAEDKDGKVLKVD